MTATGMHAYALHGYRLETDLPMPGYLAASVIPEAPEDVLRLRYDGDGPPCPEPQGEVLADLCDPARRQVYRFTRSPDRLVMRFTGAAEVVTDPRLRQGVARAWPNADPGVLSVLLPGSVMAARLILDGHLTLHASAFEVDGAAVAVVGGSGMGKSTLAALAVIAGHRLVTDDVLRTEVSAPGVRVWPGAAESRLRPSAGGVVPLFATAGTVRSTADGRTAVGAAPSGAPGLDGPLRLRCCVVPFPSRTSTAVSVRPLGPFEALRRLSAFPRVVGWCDRATSAQQFQLLADLCERVPVVEAEVPWGPPFDSGVIADLVAALPT